VIPLGRAHVFIDTLLPIREGRLFRWGYGPDEPTMQEYGGTSIEGADATGAVSLDAQATDVLEGSPFARWYNPAPPYCAVVSPPHH
jgi:hypothetical protein